MSDGMWAGIGKATVLVTIACPVFYTIDRVATLGAGYAILYGTYATALFALTALRLFPHVKEATHHE